jgi:hypothetical protein
MLVDEGYLRDLALFQQANMHTPQRESISRYEQFGRRRCHLELLYGAADDFDEVLPVLADQEYVNMLGCDSAMSRT